MNETRMMIRPQMYATRQMHEGLSSRSHESKSPPSSKRSIPKPPSQAPPPTPPETGVGFRDPEEPEDKTEIRITVALSVQGIVQKELTVKFVFPGDS